MNKEELVKQVIAGRIRGAIAKKGWKKKEIAKLMNVNPCMITRWISGNHNFTLTTLIIIEEALDIKLIYLGRTIVSE